MPWTVNPAKKIETGGAAGGKGKSYYGAGGGKTVPEKFATLKRELSKINQNLKQTIKRMNSNNSRSAMSSSREGEGEAKIRISELLNSQR